MAQLGTMTIHLEPESIKAMNNLAEALDRNGMVADQRLLSILRDVWFQYSLDRRIQFHGTAGRWAGGLSVLEDVERELRAAGMIDENGLERE